MTNKQRQFIEEYLIDLNGTQAAIRAGYSPNTAHEQAAQNLAKLSIRTAIDKALAERSKRTGVNADRVIAELAGIAFAAIPENEITVRDKLKALETLLDHVREIGEIAPKPPQAIDIAERLCELDDVIDREAPSNE